MSLVILGLSHHTAPLSLLEAMTLDADGRRTLSASLTGRENLTEAIVVSTCNRTEVYAESTTFHGAVTDIADALTEVTGVARDELREHLYVHYEDRAIAHAFTVACGLDSMAVGEAQILGQMRTALRESQKAGHAGPALNTLFQQALRVGKRAHTETGIDAVSVSLVEAGLARAERELGPLTGLKVLVVGAGGMSSLAATTVARRGAAGLTIVNRTLAKAVRLAERTGGTARPLADLSAAIAGADVVVSCTGSTGVVVDLATAGDAQVARAGRPQAYIDLALPHDVAPEVASLSGVTLAGLAALGEELSGGQTPPQVSEVADLVIGEVAAYLTSRAAESVAPTVAALRSHAADVVAGELTRLDQRLPDLDEVARAEVQLAVHRIVEKLLHTPTIRVKERAVGGQGADYAEALRELFDLRPGEAATASGPAARAGRYAVSAPAVAPLSLRLGTRRSALATTQSTWVADLLREQGHTVELVEIVTEGDTSTASLASIGGTGVFAAALRRALLAGEVDFAVHSLKDLPTTPEPGLVIAAVPVREDPRDVLVASGGRTLGELGEGAVVGTGSPRRVAQLAALGLGLSFKDIRGNVDTRIALVRDGALDGVVLARAGLARLGRLDEVAEAIDPLQMLPAPGQGALAVECRADDAATLAALAGLDDPDTRACVTAERAVLAALEAGCSAPVGALAEVVEGEDGLELSLRAFVGAVDGSFDLRRSLVGGAEDAEALGRRLAAVLLEDGGDLLRGPEERPPAPPTPFGDGPVSRLPEAPPPDPAKAIGTDPLAASERTTDRKSDHDSTERAL